MKEETMTHYDERNIMQTLVRAGTRLPAAYELLRWVGIQRRRSRMARTARYAGLIATGALIGGGIAALVTPQSGAQMRRLLGSQAKRAREYVTHENGTRTQKRDAA
jgi:hypothetical protein